MSGITKLPDGSAFFVDEIDTSKPFDDTRPEFQWNPWNKVVQSEVDGTIDHAATNIERAKRGLSVPWTPQMAETEPHEPPIL